MAEKHTCCAQARAGGDRWNRRYKPCGKAASVCDDGKWYCKTHSPSLRKAKFMARAEARSNGYKAQQAQQAQDAADAELGRRVRAIVNKWGGIAIRDPEEVGIIGAADFVVNINTKRRYANPAEAPTLDEAVRRAAGETG